MRLAILLILCVLHLSMSKRIAVDGRDTPRPHGAAPHDRALSFLSFLFPFRKPETTQPTEVTRRPSSSTNENKQGGSRTKDEKDKTTGNDKPNRDSSETDKEVKDDKKKEQGDNPTPLLAPSNSSTKKPKEKNQKQKTTDSPSVAPTVKSTVSPTGIPTVRPTLIPTEFPTSSVPTTFPSISVKTPTPTEVGSMHQEATSSPSMVPTVTATKTPTQSPTRSPTNSPTQSPTQSPTLPPTQLPTTAPSPAPSQTPSISSSLVPSPTPTDEITETPSESLALKDMTGSPTLEAESKGPRTSQPFTYQTLRTFDVQMASLGGFDEDQIKLTLEYYLLQNFYSRGVPLENVTLGLTTHAYNSAKTEAYHRFDGQAFHDKSLSVERSTIHANQKIFLQEIQEIQKLFDENTALAASATTVLGIAFPYYESADDSTVDPTRSQEEEDILSDSQFLKTIAVLMASVVIATASCLLGTWLVQVRVRRRREERRRQAEQAAVENLYTESCRERNRQLKGQSEAYSSRNDETLSIPSSSENNAIGAARTTISWGEVSVMGESSSSDVSNLSNQLASDDAASF